MAKKIVPDLENAILELPTKEKNKLLLRLISKDPVLTEQLHFKLLEDPAIDLEIRRKTAKAEIENEIRYNIGVKNSKQVLISMRKAYTIANKHKKITADKYGEVELSVFILTSYFHHFKAYFNNQIQDFNIERLYTYVPKKIELTLKLTRALHEDYHIDFVHDINNILTTIHSIDWIKWAVAKLPLEFE